MFSFKNSNHQPVGPIPADEIRRLISGGVITRFTLLRAEGTDFWRPAGKFLEFGPLFEQLTPPSGEGATPVVEVTAEVSPALSAKTESNAAEEPLPAGSTDANQPPAAEPASSAEGRYFMIGGDGREYGPVTGQQLRAWISQRRANAETRIRREGQAESIPLADWPEFAAALGGDPRPPLPPPPAMDSAQADQLADEILGRGYDLAIGRCLTRSWKLYTSNFWLLTGTTAVVLILHSVLHSVPALGNVAAVVLGGVLTAGLSMVFLKLIRGGRAEFSDLFCGFQRNFVQLMLASTITFILVSAGLLLCALPGIYLFVAWLFTYPLAIERSLGFWSAMELSRKVVHERWWEVFALTLVTLMLFVGGFLLTFFIFGLGGFFTAPIAFGALMYAYEDIFGESGRRDA